mmetsp:Transcript_9312/g.37732  ORF Transcript_9312/g.37732 Transcript_9312/m.37732 type:complete len:314 (-) Transcript_9312:181-1122(-)
MPLRADSDQGLPLGVLIALQRQLILRDELPEERLELLQAPVVRRVLHEHLEHVVDPIGRQTRKVCQHPDDVLLVNLHPRRRLVLRGCNRAAAAAFVVRGRCAERGATVVARGEPVRGSVALVLLLHEQALVDPDHRLATERRSVDSHLRREFVLSPPILALEVRQHRGLHGGHRELQLEFTTHHLHLDHAERGPPHELPRRLEVVIPLGVRVDHVFHLSRELKVGRLVGERRPEQRADDGGVQRGVLENIRGRSVASGWRAGRGRSLDVAVDSLGVEHVLEHDLALVKGRLAEPDLQQLERVHLPGDVVPNLR